jgi:hypothetical protein
MEEKRRKMKVMGRWFGSKQFEIMSRKKSLLKYRENYCQNFGRIRSKNDERKNETNVEIIGS